MPHIESDHLIQLRKEREEVARSIEHWSQPGASFGSSRGGAIKDGTAKMVEEERLRLAELDDQIADHLNREG